MRDFHLSKEITKFYSPFTGHNMLKIIALRALKIQKGKINMDKALHTHTNIELPLIRKSMGRAYCRRVKIFNTFSQFQQKLTV